MTETSGHEHLILISADGHAGGNHEQYRSDLESKYLDEFELRVAIGRHQGPQPLVGRLLCFVPTSPTSRKHISCVSVAVSLTNSRPEFCRTSADVGQDSVTQPPSELRRECCLDGP